MKIGKHTDYRGYQENDQVIQWFWKCINEWDSEQKARLLQFTTGTSVYQLMVSKIYKVVMDQEDLLLKSW